MDLPSVKAVCAQINLALNLTDPPLKDHPDLRQAISMALDRELIAEYTGLGTLPAYSLAPHGVGGYQPPEYAWSLWPRDRRLNIPRDLYARAGYSIQHPLRLRDRQQWDIAKFGWWADDEDAKSFLDNFSTGNAKNDPTESMAWQRGNAELERRERT